LATWKQLSFIPIAFLAVYCFSAQNANQLQDGNDPLGLATYATKNGASNEALEKYQKIIARYKTPNLSWTKFAQVVSKSDKERMITIFNTMSKVQQADQDVIFLPIGGQLPKVVPTQEQIQKWKNTEEYGVWIDGTRVLNSALSQAHASDFSRYNISNLDISSTHYGKLKYQLNLMTNARFIAYNSKAQDQEVSYRILFKEEVR